MRSNQGLSSSHLMNLIMINNERVRRGDRILFQDGANTLQGTVIRLYNWKDMLALSDNDTFAQEFARSTSAKYGVDWKSLFWKADVDVSGFYVIVECDQFLSKCKE